MQKIIADFFAKQPGVLLFPATLDEAPSRQTTGSPALNSPWSFLGLPTVSMPFAWSDNGLPLGIQLIAPRNHDFQLLRFAAQFEHWLHFPHREIPYLEK